MQHFIIFILLFTFNICHGYPSSSEIDLLANQAALMISEGSIEEVPYEESEHTLIGLKAFEEMEIASSPQEAVVFFHDLAMEYSKASHLPEFHSFESISQNLQKLDKKSYAIVVEELIELGKLKKSISLLKKNLHTLDVHPGTWKSLPDLSRSLENLIHQIVELRSAYIHEYFYRLIEKTDREKLQQTVQALSLADLNELIHHLELKTNFLQRENDLTKDTLKNKKVVIFTCSYGTGHNMTALAIKQMLTAKGAKVEIHDLSTGALLGRDRVRLFCKMLGVNYNEHPLNSVDLFNTILRNQYYFIVNTKDNVDLFVRQMLNISGKSGIASAAGILKNSWEKTQLREILLAERADHLITTYHMDLNPILEVAEELRIPLLHIPTDYNMKQWEVFGKVPPAYPHFKSTVPNENIATTLESRAPLDLSSLVHGIGIPLRSAFYRSLTGNEIKAYRQERGVEIEEKVLFISGGGNGQYLPHPELLANSKKWNIPLRIEVIAGKNREYAFHLQSRLKKINEYPLVLQGNNPFVTIEVVQNSNPSKWGTEEKFFVAAEELSKLLDISDVSLAKAGGLSTAELLFKGVPIIFDHRLHPFSWELFNIETVINAKRGMSNFSLSNFEKDLMKALTLPKDISEHFHFEHAAEILCETVREQIESLE